MTNEINDEIRTKINKRFDEFFNKQEGKFHPYVCLVCDIIIRPRNLTTININTLNKHKQVLEDSTRFGRDMDKYLRSDYIYKGRLNSSELTNSETSGIRSWMDKLLLSPRATYLSSNSKRCFKGHHEGISCCVGCKDSLWYNEMPKWAIANNNMNGATPTVLSDLTEVELAFLTPVKSYGYCISYTGGARKQLKGSLSYYKVNHESIANSVCHFDALGLTTNIVIVFFGKMTALQAEKANRLRKVRPYYVRRALDWLMRHNSEWKKRNIDIAKLMSELKNPVLVNNSTEAISEDSNVERRDSFEVFFPDGSMTGTNGGQQNIDEYRELIRLASQNGYDIRLRCDLSREACADFKDNNLVNSCLLQFPYGRGGIHEERLNGDGSSFDTVETEEFVEHLSKLSLPQFHKEQFVLIMYNMRMKQNMVKTASFRVRNKIDVQEISRELKAEDTHDALRSKLNGTNSNSRTGRKFMETLDTISGNLPHTNDAARKARRDGEALQHHFGLPSYFLTVTPDDENSFIVQVYTGVTVDDNRPVSSLSDSELLSRSKARRTLRVTYPGMCAMFFNDVLEIIIEEVLGYDFLSLQPKEDGTPLFENVQAFTVSIEEQGRGTLHAHIQIWIKKFNEEREKLHHDNPDIRCAARKHLKEHFEERAECKLVEPGLDRLFPRYFPHNCPTILGKRKNPFVVQDQQLRNLRHRMNDKHDFACCPHCAKSWTNTQFVESYLLNTTAVPGLTCYPDTESKRLKAMAVEHQRDGTKLDPVVMRAGYNHHIHTASSCHGLKGRAKKSDEKVMPKRTGKLKFLEECRYRLPQKARPVTKIRDASENGIEWYRWDGTKSERNIKEVVLRRNKYDAFQNVSCTAVSASKLTCNTNITVLMPGPIGQCAFKYNLKDTQKDDVSKYETLLEATTRSLAKVRDEEKSDKSEAIRRILRSSFAHLSTNILGPSMASYLNRNGSRFIFSHQTVWCPLRDLKEMLSHNTGTAMLSYHGKVPYFVNISLNYLCRPEILHGLNVKEFYENYEVIRRTKKNDSLLWNFLNTEAYTHPSFRETTGKFLSGVRKRAEKKLLKVYQFEFPDTQDFGGDILQDDTIVNESMEKYSQLALMLFYPFRSQIDIKTNGSFTVKFREVVRNGLISNDNFNFLQNLQDTKSNSWRSKMTEDELQSCTECYEPKQDAEEEMEEEMNELEGELLDEMLSTMMNHDGGFCSGPLERPKTLNVRDLRMKGKHECGYNNLALMEESTTHEEAFVEIHHDDSDEGASPGASQTIRGRNGKTPSRWDIVTIIATQSTRRFQSFESITGEKRQAKILPANGSAHSIVDWAKNAGLDYRQRRAFEVICGQFVLEFYSDAPNDVVRSTFSMECDCEWKLLLRLVERDRRKSDQLLCLLHGPGGSGKTTVIDLVKLCAKEYCSYMEHYNFTDRTIVVTAITGVAATILLGETTSRACLLNQKKQISTEQVEAWAETKLLIIDEVSFMDKGELQTLHKRLRILKQNLEGRFGGVNIIFAGDFRQLEPVGKGKKSLYATHCTEFHEWMNCYIELDGLHRFKKDPEWGMLLSRFRNGTATSEDIDLINERLVERNAKPEDLPENIRCATYRNVDRDCINAALFYERCKRKHVKQAGTDDSLIIFSDNVKMKNSNKKFVPIKDPTMYWTECGENDLCFGDSSQRMDPTLKLYRDCRLMMTANKNVQQGEANGTQALVKRVVLKNGEIPFAVKMNEDIPVKAVMASQISCVEFQHCNDRIKPAMFRVEPKEHTFRLRLPKRYDSEGTATHVNFKATQIPLVVTNATTGHKLQGSGVDNLFVHDWVYVTNWVCVMLSRVKTRKGLFARKLLDKDLRKYRVPDKLTRLINRFRDTIEINYWEEEEYQSFLL